MHVFLLVINGQLHNNQTRTNLHYIKHTPTTGCPNRTAGVLTTQVACRSFEQIILTKVWTNEHGFTATLRNKYR